MAIQDQYDRIQWTLDEYCRHVAPSMECTELELKERFVQDYTGTLHDVRLRLLRSVGYDV